MSARAPAGGDDEPALIAGRYRLGELLGVGGTASVYEATDTAVAHIASADTDEPDRRLVLKIMHEHLVDDDAGVAEFLSAAELARGIRAPGITATIDAGQHVAAGVVQPWVAIERVDGDVLADIVAQDGPLPLPAALEVATGVLRGLDALHGAGLVHRDLTPSNVMLAGRLAAADAVRIVDLGLLARAGEPVSRAARADAPESGVEIVGSPHYLSPEHVRAQGIVPASDIYQTGALLFFMLTGLPPFIRDTVEHVLEAHLMSPPPPPSARRPDLPVGVDRLVTRAMAKAPGRRFSTASEMAIVVAQIARDDEDARWPATVVATRTGVTEVFPAPDVDRRRLAPATAAALVGAPRRAPSAIPAWTGSPMVWLVVVIVTLVGTATVLGVIGGPPSEAAPTGSPSAPPPAAAEPPAAVVYTYVPAAGGSLDTTTAALTAAGLRPEIAYRPSTETRGEVLALSPAAGARVARGGTVTVTVASGENLVPDVSGMSLEGAVGALHDAGFEVGSEHRPSADIPLGYPSGTLPEAGTAAPLGSTIMLLIATAVPPAPAPTAPAPEPTGTPMPDPDDDGTAAAG